MRNVRYIFIAQIICQLVLHSVDCGMTMWREQRAVRLDIWKEFLFRKITGERDMQRTC